MWIWLVGWLCASGMAQTLEDFFPRTPVSSDVVADVLTPAILGEPATRYDGRTADATLDRNRRVLAMAQGVDVADVAVPRSLQRFARLALALSRRGKADRVHYWFIAEHAGLPMAPRVVSSFVAGTEEGLAEIVAEAAAELKGRPMAVATEEIERGFVGVLAAMDGVVDFEPFPRLVEPGASVRIPGTVLDSGSRYALYVQGEGTTVEEYPLEGDGAFDIEFAVPRTPGAYRVAMTRFEKRRMPGQPFFFTLYVGVPAPSAPYAVGATLHEPQDLLGYEGALVQAINAERARYELAPVTRASDGTEMRALLDGLPNGERAQVRYLRRELARDPMPDQPHGTWGVAFGNSHTSPEAAAWAWVQHPALRQDVLHADQRTILVGARHDVWGFDAVGVMIRTAAETESVYDEAWDSFAGRWAGGGPKKAPELEVLLTDLAARIATEKKGAKKFGKAIDKIFARRDIVKGRASANMWVVPPGQELDTSPMVVPPWGKHLAIGTATGDLGEGKGYTYAVVVAIIAADAK